MHYELQALVACPSTVQDCPGTMLEVANELESKLKAAGFGFVVEVRDIRQGEKLFRSIDPGKLAGGGP